MKIFNLPDLGEGTTEAEIVRWLVMVGDTIAVDEPIAEVETVKARVEVPCPYAGTVKATHGMEGETLVVGHPLITIETAVSAVEEGGTVLVGSGLADAPSRSARRRAARSMTRGSAPEPAPPASQQTISPLVRRLASEHEISLDSLAAETGRSVRRRDVERVITRQDATPSVTPTEGGGAVRLPLRGVERAAAEQFVRSRREIADATVWVDADATKLMEARASLGGPVGGIGLSAILARMCVSGLVRFPSLNSSVDLPESAILHHESVNLGIAVQTKRGVLVPVVKAAERRTTQGLSDEMDRLTTSARDGALKPADLTGGTFTLNNYGVFGVDGADAIINYPEAAILGIGRIMDRPWVVQGELAVRKVVQLSLSFDHRVCDGGAAAGFLRHVAELIENPFKLLHAF
ncbi:dihydrolipoamide acetyltransferase family protein [Streptomyces rhizosphaericus]|uniref:Dihydrolipoamide acetyltransferase component of pyruvate dehydrogenase complex n=1 Tax=Streptomyces rhizosphaericus TaxID=114699 RepID=A0A6G4AY00_9ACTN|nr:2-oxo acid dehydrogenase subunit E2 [Streptomyces rhizosphaericus]